MINIEEIIQKNIRSKIPHKTYLFTDATGTTYNEEGMSLANIYIDYPITDKKIDELLHISNLSKEIWFCDIDNKWRQKISEYEFLCLVGLRKHAERRKKSAKNVLL